MAEDFKYYLPLRRVLVELYLGRVVYCISPVDAEGNMIEEFGE